MASANLPPLPQIIIEPIVRMALAEDFGNGGDVTADLLIPASQKASLYFHSRENGVIAGMQAAALTFALVDPAVKFKVIKGNGSRVKKGDHIATVTGPVRSLLMAERVALNFLGRMSGVATLTSQYVKAVKGTKARIAATRKTTPGLRALEKRAVQCGGGFTHRQSLSDAVMIKDNHIALAGGISKAVRAIKSKADHMIHISVEVDTLAQFKKVIPLAPNVVLLDNMSNAKLAKAVAMNAGGPITLEASGGVNLDTVAAIAASGVDVISVGALTHSAPNFDIGLDADK
ncbi:MAG: carboxylating nicotinate-nucleotide diphosphorylase [Robiginitomaculum sp.]